MENKILLQKTDRMLMVKDIGVVKDPQKLKMMLNNVTWKILLSLSDEEMYPLELARKLGIHEQKAYYHIRKLAKAGAIKIAKEEEKKGAIAKYYVPTSQAFGIELPRPYRTIHSSFFMSVESQLQEFFKEFIQDDTFDGKIVVGCPMPHGPFKTSARDGHYASYLTFFLGQFSRIPDQFMIKLDVDVKAEKDEGNNLILVGGPGTNLITQEINEYLPIRFNMQPSERGFLFGGLYSKKTGRIYTADTTGLVARIINPWDKNKRIIVLAGNKAVGTKACVLALTIFWKKTLAYYNGEEAYAKIIQGTDLDGDGKVDSIDILE